jgi:hypothetical protein
MIGFFRIIKTVIVQGFGVKKAFVPVQIHMAVHKKEDNEEQCEKSEELIAEKFS